MTNKKYREHFFSVPVKSLLFDIKTVWSRGLETEDWRGCLAEQRGRQATERSFVYIHGEHALQYLWACELLEESKQSAPKRIPVT